MNLPEKYLKDMQELLKEDYQKYIDCFSKDFFHGLRVNTKKISIDDFKKEFPNLRQVIWCDSGFYFDKEEKFSKHPYYYGGLFYLQEPSAMIPAAILEIEDGDRILDLCAAPGGKSVQISCKMNDTNILYSNDISASRCQGLIKNLQLAGVKNSVVLSEPSSKLAQRFENYFDKILVDAPCSGQGMFRKDSSLVKSYQNKNDSDYAPLQKEILKDAIKMLKPNGKLVYSTCTFSTKENEEVILDAMKQFPELRLLDFEKYDVISDGKSPIEKAGRLYPFSLDGEGHFVCYLQKGQGKTSINVEIDNCDAILPEYVKEFTDQLLWNRKYYHYEVIGNKVLLVSNFKDKCLSLRVMKSGVIIGQLNNNRFEPSNFLALSLKKEEFKQVINLKLDDSRVIKYLKCETIDVKEYDYQGYVLICVNDHPLGFGKIDNHIFKNKYDKAWRYI